MTTSWRVFGKHETELRNLEGKTSASCPVLHIHYVDWVHRGTILYSQKTIVFFLFKKTDSKRFETILTIIELSRGVINILFSEQCF